MRRYVPYEARLRVALWRRWLRDHGKGLRFPARTPADLAAFPNEVCRYTRPIIDYPGQLQLGAAKRHNLSLLASQLNGTLIAPGQTFSVWRQAQRPTLRNGYAAGAALRDGELRSEVGGSTCLLSTVLYNVALLGAMDVVERHCHSVDLYGEARYFELGRDASIEFGYLDLRFRNPHDFPVVLVLAAGQDCVTGRLRSPRAHGFCVEIGVSEPAYEAAGEKALFDATLPRGMREVRSEGMPGVRTVTSRTVTFAGGSSRIEMIAESRHRAVPALIAYGADPVPGVA